MFLLMKFIVIGLEKRRVLNIKTLEIATSTQEIGIFSKMSVLILQSSVL